MKLKNQVCIAAITGFLSAVLLYSVRKYRSTQRLKQVAAEGYETAHEVLFPHVKDLGNKLRYGPVLPD